MPGLKAVDATARCTYLQRGVQHPGVNPVGVRLNSVGCSLPFQTTSGHDCSKPAFCMGANASAANPPFKFLIALGGGDKGGHGSKSSRWKLGPSRNRVRCVHGGAVCVLFFEGWFSSIISFLLAENPERAALYFVSGVCIGLVLTLLALVLRVSCRTDCKRSSSKKPPRERESDSDSSDSDDDSDTTSDLSARRHRRFERTLNMNVFTSAEELERAQRLEERERIIREIWMNGQPDIPGTRSLNRYY